MIFSQQEQQKKLKLMMENIEMLQAVFWIMIISLFVGGIWALAEKIVYGQITPRILDDIICLALSISIYYNIFK